MRSRWELIKASKQGRADSRVTREKILATSIQLFSEHGHDGVSMRAIAEAADVNLAAMNYHFGSKMQLFESAFEHCAAPISIERLHRLDQLELADHPPSTREIIRAFVDVNVMMNEGMWPRMIARVFAESPAISGPLLERVFAPTVNRFLVTLQKTLPGLDPEELELRFHFLVGSMLHLFRFNTPLRVGAGTSRVVSQQDKIEALIEFVAAGLCQENSHAGASEKANNVKEKA
jgi:AcrR family transcriptional regulator